MIRGLHPCIERNEVNTMLNHIDIMGDLVADPELKSTSSGISVCSFRIACERDFSAAGSRKESDFIDCVAWREKAEFVCKHFTKGMPIMVSGRLQMRKWEDRDGNKRISAEVQAESVYFAGGERRHQQETTLVAGVVGTNSEYDVIWDKSEGELPF